MNGEFYSPLRSRHQDSQVSPTYGQRLTPKYIKGVCFIPVDEKYAEQVIEYATMLKMKDLSRAEPVQISDEELDQAVGDLFPPQI